MSLLETHINPLEIAKFDEISGQWWNQKDGPHQILHQLTPLRIDYIQRMIAAHGVITPQPLEILDVGCGGGLLCEPLSRLGYRVQGIDASLQAIEIANAHAQRMELNIPYHCGDVRQIKGVFDVAISFEVLEHVDDVRVFLRALKSKIRPGGLLMVSTLHQTIRSYLGAILWAEKVSKMVPKGTHNWNQFVKPSTILKALELPWDHLLDIQGYTYIPWSGEWKCIDSIAVNYFITLRV